MNEDIKAKLKAIIVKHTVVGGYPNTRKIAEEAFALGAEQKAGKEKDSQP